MTFAGTRRKSKNICWLTWVVGGLIAWLCFKGTRAAAHPVVFAGGTALMGHHHGSTGGLSFTHSPKYWLGVGAGFDRSPVSTEALGHFNVLLWRGNFPDLQSNFYAGVAGGRRWGSGQDHGSPQEHGADHGGSSDSQEESWLARWMVEADAEDRRYYGKVSYAETYDDNQAREQKLTARAGLAPYKAAAKEMAVWGILEWTTTAKQSGSRRSEPSHEVTPLIRLFYQNALIEAGVSFQGTVVFNYMFHFF
jgi:hypothetical protein